MTDDHDPDRKPVQRTVGKRKRRPGPPLTAEERWPGLTSPRYVLRAPKGVYFYSSHEEMEADRIRWTVDLLTQRDPNR